MKFARDITRVPFGRTDVLIGANDAPSPDLSNGHGLKDPGPQNGCPKLDWHGYLLFNKCRTKKNPGNGFGYPGRCSSIRGPCETGFGQKFRFCGRKTWIFMLRSFRISVVLAACVGNTRLPLSNGCS